MPRAKQANVIPMFPSGANDVAPGDELRDIADAYETGDVEGVLIAYVMKDGTVKYKTMGALAERENLGSAVTVAGELQHRLDQLRFFSPR